jgi:hypothetical protein
MANGAARFPHKDGPHLEKIGFHVTEITLDLLEVTVTFVHRSRPHLLLGYVSLDHIAAIEQRSVGVFLIIHDHAEVLSLKGEGDKRRQLVAFGPCAELTQACLRVGPLRSVDKLVACFDKLLQLVEFIAAAAGLLSENGLIAPQDESELAIFDFLGGLFESIDLQDAFVQKLPDLGVGQCGNVLKLLSAQRLLAFGLDHPPVANKDNLIDFESVRQDLDLIGHSDRVSRIAFEYLHGQGLTIIGG